MAKKKEKIEEAAPVFKEDTMTSAPPPRRKRKMMHWFLAAGVLAAAFVFFATRSGDETAQIPTEEAAATADAANQDVLAQELNGAPPPPADGTPVDQSVPPSDPQVASAEEPMPIPEPVTADNAGGDMNAAPAGAEPEMQAQMAEPEPPHVAPPKPKKKAAAPKAAAKKTPAKKYTLTLNKKGIKVPAALNKTKVTSFLSKKLEGDKTCVPGKLAKKDVKPFNATVSVSKTGTITSVDIKPKLPEAKAITSCLKKKLAGNSAVFKSKSASKITVALKVK